MNNHLKETLNTYKQNNKRIYNQKHLNIQIICVL